jgi:hypothetical protein
VLSHDCATRGDPRGADDHSREARRLATQGAALWTREIVARLDAR